MRLAHFLALGFSILSLLPAGAAAQSGDDELARVHFQAGRSYYDRGEYERSIEEFQRAYDLSRRAELFYNLSLSYQQLGDLDNAIRYLERYLVEVPEVPERANKEVRLANLRERRAANPSTPTGHGVAAAVPDAPRNTTNLQVPTESVRGDSGGGGGIPSAALASFIVAGVGLITMTTFGLLALNEQSSVEDGCGRLQQCSRDEVSTMDRLALLSDAGLLLAILGSGIGVAFLFLNDGDSSDSAELQLAPWASADAGGMLLDITF